MSSHPLNLTLRFLLEIGALVAIGYWGLGQWLQALSYALSQPREIAIVGDPNSADTQALLHVVRDGYRPFQVAALGPPSNSLSPGSHPTQRLPNATPEFYKDPSASEAKHQIE
jgi:hypothetical protein